MAGRNMATSLFISYSRADMQDTDWLARLRMYLTPFRRSGAIDVWDDSRIAPGSDEEQGSPPHTS